MMENKRKGEARFSDNRLGGDPKAECKLSGGIAEDSRKELVHCSTNEDGKKIKRNASKEYIKTILMPSDERHIHTVLITGEKVRTL